MTDYRRKLLADPVWLNAERSYVADLVDACNKTGISLWVNIEINGTKDNVKFKKLTQ
jgi:hypothetical protein